MNKLSEGQQEQVKKLRSEGMTFKEIAAKIKELYQIKVSLSSLQLLCSEVKIDGRGKRGRKAKPRKAKADENEAEIIQSIRDIIAGIRAKHIEDLKKLREKLLRA